MNPFEDNMNKALQKLAENVIPSDEYLKGANICADNIIKLLQAKSRFDIGKVCMSGSAGKKTTIIGSDIDCVLFINDAHPPFKDVLEDFECILTTTDSFNIRDVHKTRCSVQFKALQFEFDILPAANLTKGLQGNDDNLINIQQQRVLDIIKRDPKKYGYMYSSSLAFSVLRFMKQQNGFVNEMVRLAKFWYKTLRFDDNRAGEKNCIELIAVHAAKEEEAMPTKSYLRTFERFIKYIQNFDNLNIHFGMDEHRFLDQYRPRVMDPVNPYNNLARNWDRESVQLLKCYVNESKNRLNHLANLRIAHLEFFFEPQPVYRQDLNEIFRRSPTGSNWLTSTEHFSLLPDLKVRNERFHTDAKLKKGLDILKSSFEQAVCASNASNYKKEKIKEVVQNTISRQIYNTNLTWGAAEKEEHDDYDITFTIPMNSTEAIRVSYRL